MAHELKTTFSSTFFSARGGDPADPGDFVPDILGDFDLNNIADNGNMAGCTRRRISSEPITGQARVASPNPFAFDIRINQARPIRVSYRGVALRNDRGEVTRIVGHVVFNVTEAERQQFGIDKLLPPSQNDTTWVATKP
jgi:hypothetical protein